jgi:hypothetical protein
VCHNNQAAPKLDFQHLREMADYKAENLTSSHRIRPEEHDAKERRGRVSLHVGDAFVEGQQDPASRRAASKRSLSAAPVILSVTTVSASWPNSAN